MDRMGDDKPPMTSPKHRITPRALLELKIPYDPHVSPDGKRVVFAVTEADFEESRWVSHLWLADTTEGHARRITFSYEGERSPRWSPDGRHIAFLSSRPDMTEPPPQDEDEEQASKEQLWALPVEGGEAQRLTHLREGVRSFDWMPDGKTILFLAPEARPQPMQFARDDARKRKLDATVELEDRLRLQFWEVGVEDKKPELIFTGDYGVAEFDIAPDGKRIVFNTNHTGEANDYYAYDLFVLNLEDHSEPRKVVEREGGKFQPQWSPDGKRIAFLANLDPSLSYSQECVWEIDAEGGEPRNLFANAPYDTHQLLWSRADGGLCALVADRTNGPLIRIEGGEVRPVTPTDAALDVHDFDVGMGRVTVAVVEDAASPPELYRLESTGERKPLTELNKEFGERYALPRQEVVRWRSDSWEIEGVLVSPPDSEPGRPLPLVVQVHGGPKGRVTNTLRSYSMHPVWAAEGYLVFRPNFRGSEGYGNEFAIANRRDLGGGDFRDIMTGVDLLVERGLADPARIGIMGGSYGGYMTNWAIGQTDRFAAAISEFGIFSLITDYSNSEIARWDRDYTGAYYWEDPEIYRKLSPATFVERMKTPVLIIHGESDNNTFLSNSKEMYRALKDRGATVQFVHYPREGHGLREPNHKLDEMRRCLAWFDRYLKGNGETPPAYQIADRIMHDGYELTVLRVEDVSYTNRHEEDARLLEIAFSLASQDPVEEGWQFRLDQIQLRGQDTIYALRGVPIDAGGGRTLVEGSDLTLNLQPDKDTGRLGFAAAAAFEVPAEGGVMELRIADFPPVSFAVGPKEEKEEKEEHAKASDESKETRTSESVPTPVPPPDEQGPPPKPLMG